MTEKYLSPAELESMEIGEKLHVLRKSFVDVMTRETSVELFQIMFGRARHCSVGECKACGIDAKNGNTIDHLSTSDYWFFRNLNDAQKHAASELLKISKKWSDAAEEFVNNCFPEKKQ
jgi:hypothetical protein